MKNEIVESLAQSPLPRTSGGKYAQAFANVERLRASAAAKVGLLETIVATKGKTSSATPVSVGKNITAAAFAASTAAPRMSATEFGRLSQTDRARYLSAGGSLFDEVIQPVAKTPLAERKRNSLWIADFNKMSASQKAKHVANGGNLHD